MTLTGEYTQAGAQLAAQIQAGTASLTLTRAVAGPGTTATDATAMASEKQTLTLLAHTLSGTTLTVPVRLFSVEAAEAYTMRELGLYALNAEGGEVLYKLYRFSQAVSVSPLCALNATFYLNDTVAAGSQPTVQVSAQGLLTGEDIPDIIAQTMARGVLTSADIPGIISQTMAKGVLTNANIPSITSQAVTQVIGQIGERKGLPTGTSQTITCKSSTLQSTINGLSRLINNNVKIEVTQDTDISAHILEISGFFGTGELTIACATQISVGTIRIHGNRLRRIMVDNMRTALSGMSITSLVPSPYHTAMVYVENSSLVDLRRITAVHTGPTSSTSLAGIYVENSHCILTNYLCQNSAVSILGQRMARINVRSFSMTGAHNISYVFRLFNGSTLAWPGATSTLGTQTGCSTYSCATGATVFFGGSTLETGTGFSANEY